MHGDPLFHLLHCVVVYLLPIALQIDFESVLSAADGGEVIVKIYFVSAFEMSFILDAPQLPF